MSVLRFEIRYPNGHREAAVVEGERALIGSASHCDVRLPMDAAAYEHVLIEVQGSTLRAESKATSENGVGPEPGAGKAPAANDRISGAMTAPSGAPRRPPRTQSSARAPMAICCESGASWARAASTVRGRQRNAVP